MDAPDEHPHTYQYREAGSDDSRVMQDAFRIKRGIVSARAVLENAGQNHANAVEGQGKPGYVSFNTVPEPEIQGVGETDNQHTVADKAGGHQFRALAPLVA